MAASARDAAAAAAAAEAEAPLGSVDSFQRAVLRRYEPLRRDTADAMIAERTRADRTLTASQRWALTGSDTGPAAQAPLGRRAEGAEPPRELQGVRYRWDPAPPAGGERRAERHRRHHATTTGGAPSASDASETVTR